MTWWHWAILAVAVWGVWHFLHPDSALGALAFLIISPALIFWCWPVLAFYKVRRWVRGLHRCRCGHRPPAGARWCPRCGIGVREWREKGMTCYLSGRTDPAHRPPERMSSPAPPPKRPADTTGPRSRTRTDEW